MKQITDEIVAKNVDFMVDGITNVIKSCGKRMPGSDGEAKAQEHFTEMLKGYTDDIKTDKFKLNPDAFFGWIYFCVIFVPLGIVALWFNLNIVATVLCVASALLILLQLVFYKQVTAPFFPRRTSTNVLGIKKPTGEVKRRIIFCGHVDATYEWGWLHLGGAPLFLAEVFGAVSVLAFTFTMSIIGIVTHGLEIAIVAPGGYRIALIVLTAYGVPMVLTLLHFSDRRVPADGANDNLTACFESIAVLKTMKEEGIEFENTEVCALLAGSEEAGLRGSMAFAKAHKEELSDVETIVVVMETLREKEHFVIYSRDLNGTVKTDGQVCTLLQEASEQAIDVSIPFGTVTLGATDSAALAKAGIKATCLAALDHNLRDYYHTRRDTYDNMSPETLGLTYKTIMKALENYDKYGLPESRIK